MRSVILLSGGIDSTVLLAARHAADDEIIAVTFDYGQPGRQQEIDAAARVANHYRVMHHQIVPLRGVFGHVPNGEVPGRNLAFIGVGVAIAAQHSARAVLIGTNADDGANYADGRARFIEQCNEAAAWGTRPAITVQAPLIAASKAQVIDLAERLRVPLELAWTSGGDRSQ